jgi:hypothetical protein
MSHIGSLKFHFLAGATAPTTLTTPALYLVKFPEGTGGLTPSVTSIENKIPVLGILAVDEAVVVESSYEYTYKLKKFDYKVLAFLLGGATPASDTPPTTIAIGSDLAHSGWGYMEWYRNGNTAGAPSHVHSGFTCQVIPDGEISLDPETFTEISFKIKITATRGTLGAVVP